MRKLADYAFMLRDWKLAHSTYDILRKDFANDKAWKYAAGAQVLSHRVAKVDFVGNDCTYTFTVTVTVTTIETNRNTRSTS